MKKVILIGMPRTGSSLLRKLLLSTGQVVMPAEAPGGTLPATAKAFWATLHWTPDNFYRTHQWQGYESYDNDITKIQPEHTVNNTHIYDMSMVKKLYWPIVRHIFNPSGAHDSGQWFGMKDVLNSGSSLWVARFLRAMHQDMDEEEYQTVFMVRHPYNQILSHINAPWNRHPNDPDFIKKLFLKRLQDWSANMSAMHKAYVEENNAGTGLVFHYEDRNVSVKEIFQKLGFAWAEHQDEILGFRFNSSVITHRIGDELAQKAHEQYINHIFIKQFPPSHIVKPTL